MAIVATDNIHYGNIANAIREKNGTTTQYKPSEMASAIQAIQAGGNSFSAADLKDINFYDYDGTRVASYTLAEAQALTSLPAGPAHDGLVFQGWNWSLEAVKALDHPVDVGAMYITDDGKTRLHIRIWDVSRSNIPLFISQTVENGVTIDWGDGTQSETLAGTGNVNTTHKYAAVGEYTISLDAAEGCTLGFGDGSSTYCVMGDVGNSGRVYCNLLQSVNIGANVTCIDNSAFRSCFSLASATIPKGVTSIDTYGFCNCYSLTGITIPESVTTIGTYVFYDCYSLIAIAIPESVTSIGSGLLQYCHSLASVTIPESVTSIGSGLLQNCYSLTRVTIPESVTTISDSMLYACCSLASITIPESVTSIEAYAFQNCYGMGKYHMKSVTPPKLANTNAFTNIPSDCVIYVPQGRLAAYKSATNWSTYSSYMQEEVE